MKKFRAYIIILILVSTSPMSLYAQQDPQLSQYMFNNLFLNPGYSGVEGFAKFSALYRVQWLGYQPTDGDPGGAPTTQLFSLDVPILKFRSGAGFYVVNDKLGNVNNLQFMGSYAYHLEVGEAKLSFGLKAGMNSQSIDGTQYRPVDPNDPFILETKESQVRPDLGVGIFYKAEKYFAGVSLNHVIKAKFDYGLTDSLKNAMVNHLYFTGGYIYDFNYDITLKPTILLKTEFNVVSVDLTLLALYREKMWGGLSYRQSESVSVLLGYSFLKEKNLNLGYAFDYVVHAQEAKKATSHEIMLSYAMPVVSGGGKKVIRTPRFRH